MLKTLSIFGYTGMIGGLLGLLAMRTLFSSSPLVISTQVLRWKMSARRGVTADSIGYSSSFAQDSDAIIGIQEVEDDPALRELRIVEARNAAPRRGIMTTWDWSTSSFEEMEYIETDDDGDDDGDKNKSSASY